MVKALAMETGGHEVRFPEAHTTASIQKISRVSRLARLAISVRSGFD